MVGDVCQRSDSRESDATRQSKLVGEFHDLKGPDTTSPLVILFREYVPKYKLQGFHDASAFPFGKAKCIHGSDCVFRKSPYEYYVATMVRIPTR